MPSEEGKQGRASMGGLVKGKGRLCLGRGIDGFLPFTHGKTAVLLVLFGKTAVLLVLLGKTAGLLGKTAVLLGKTAGLFDKTARVSAYSIRQLEGVACLTSCLGKSAREQGKASMGSLCRAGVSMVSTARVT